MVEPNRFISTDMNTLSNESSGLSFNPGKNLHIFDTTFRPVLGFGTEKHARFEMLCKRT